MSDFSNNKNDKDLLSLLFQSNETSLQTIMKCNTYSQKFGVTLTSEDALLLWNEKNDSLKEQERIEFGESILSKLIFTFCDSPYIYQDNYVDTLARLQSIFYLFKNESLDELSDDELIERMQKDFNGICDGSLDYLEDTCLERFAREIRQGSLNFFGKYKETDYDD